MRIKRGVCNPTKEQYETLQIGFKFFNRELFGSKLPWALITLQRKARSNGYFSANEFQATRRATRMR